jgi:hypothetical protein
MIKRLAICGGLALLGVGATLAWWTIHAGESNTKSADRIPAKVWSGGSNLEIEVESSSATTMRVSFTDHDEPAGSQPTLETWEKSGRNPVVEYRRSSGRWWLLRD